MTELGYTIARKTHDIGLLISLASINPARAKAFVAGDDARRAEDAVVFAAMGETLRQLSANRFHMDGGYDKMLFRFSDPDFPLQVLAPYAGPSQEDYERFAASLPPYWRTARG